MLARFARPHDPDRDTEVAIPWVVDQDVTLQGTLRAPRIEIGLGAVLHVEDDLLLDSADTIHIAETPRLTTPRSDARRVLLVLRAQMGVELTGQWFPGPVQVVLAPPVPGEQAMPTMALSLSVRAAG